METISRRDREKSARREEIITAAEQEFCKSGFEKTSMDTIAKESQFTKRTLYQYFPSKEELFLTVAARIHERLLDYYEKALKVDGSSFDKMRLIGNAYVKFALEHPESFLLLEANFIQVNSSSQGLSALHKSRDKALSMMSQIIRSGQIDNSIRTDLDPTKTAQSIMYLIVGFFHLIIKDLNETNSESKEQVVTFINDSLSLIFEGIWNNPDFVKTTSR